MINQMALNQKIVFFWFGKGQRHKLRDRGRTETNMTKILRLKMRLHYQSIPVMLR